jgi:hypothetical protein
LGVLANWLMQITSLNDARINCVFFWEILMSKMIAVQVRKPGSLEVVDIDVPTPGPGQAEPHFHARQQHVVSSLLHREPEAT